MVLDSDLKVHHEGGRHKRVSLKGEQAGDWLLCPALLRGGEGYGIWPIER